jgi:hypothetical protein
VLKSNQPYSALIERCRQTAHDGVRDSLVAALRQSRKRLLEFQLTRDAMLIEKAALSAQHLARADTESAKPQSRPAQLALSELLERMRRHLSPNLKRLIETANSIEQGSGHDLVGVLRPGRCVRHLAAATQQLALSDRAWLVLSKTVEQRWLTDLPLMTEQIRERLQPYMPLSKTNKPFQLSQAIRLPPQASTAEFNESTTDISDTQLIAILAKLQKSIQQRKLRVDDLRSLRRLIDIKLSQSQRSDGALPTLSDAQKSALDCALTMTQPVLVEASRLPSTFASLFRGLYLLLAQHQLRANDALFEAESPWHWLLAELRLALRDGGARTHWATRTTNTLLERNEVNIELLKTCLGTAPRRQQPELEVPQAESEMGLRTMRTVLDWLQRRKALPNHARQMLRRSWSRVLLELGLRHGAESSHYIHAVATGERLCAFYAGENTEARAVRLLLREVRTGLDGLADHSTDATLVINDLAREAGTPAGDPVGTDTGRHWPRIMRMSQWVEWEPRRHEISRGRLSWISPFSGNYLFVGPFGRRMLELSPIALLQALEDGRLRLTDVNGNVEIPATRDLLARMKKTALAQGTQES